MQAARHILMVRPERFGGNPQTAADNHFQQQEEQHTAEKAIQEFDAMAALLRSNGVLVTVVQDTGEPHTPDSIFPNNWFSLHEGTLVLYPMYAANRRAERSKPVRSIIDQLAAATIDLSGNEQQGLFLEGTGSLVLDRVNRIAFACRSQRTSEALVRQWCSIMQYTPVLFNAADAQNRPIYHTNVMMCVADSYAVVCTASITAAAERSAVLQALENTGKEVVAITQEQLQQFAGNMLQVQNTSAETLLVMSSAAYHSLTGEQRGRLLAHNRILHTPLDTIETAGGGSARCMMAEIS